VHIRLLYPSKHFLLTYLLTYLGPCSQSQKLTNWIGGAIFFYTQTLFLSPNHQREQFQSAEYSRVIVSAVATLCVRPYVVNKRTLGVINWRRSSVEQVDNTCFDRRTVTMNSRKHPPCSEFGTRFQTEVPLCFLKITEFP